MLAGVKEATGTEVQGPGATGVLLREEDDLRRVQPVAGVQLAALQQDKAAPCRPGGNQQLSPLSHNSTLHPITAPSIS